MSPDNDFSQVESDEGMSALEQAQFEAMRSGNDIPETLPPGLPDPQAPQGQQVDPKLAQAPPQEDPNDPDPDIEVPNPQTGKPQKRVSIHKFDRLKKQYDEREAELDKLRTSQRDADLRNAKIEERLQIINEALTTPGGQQQTQEQPDPRPDPETDIFAYVQWQERQLIKAQERIEAFETAGKESAAEQELATTYHQDAGRFAQLEPTFAEAYVFLVRQRDAELLIAGVKDKKARDQQIVREEKGLVRGAIEDGESPAERIYNMAKGRGFVPAAPKPAANGAANGANGAAHPAPGATEPPKDPNALDAKPAARQPSGSGAPSPAQQQQAPVNVKTEIENIKRGTEAAQSLSNVGGGPVPPQLTPEILADMPEEKFNDLVNSLTREEMMDLMGR